MFLKIFAISLGGNARFFPLRTPMNPPELLINVEARNDARIASTGVRLY